MIFESTTPPQDSLSESTQLRILDIFQSTKLYNNHACPLNFYRTTPVFLYQAYRKLTKTINLHLVVSYKNRQEFEIEAVLINQSPFDTCVLYNTKVKILDATLDFEATVLLHIDRAVSFSDSFLHKVGLQPQDTIAS